MSPRRLVAVSAGLTRPSSSRMLTDRLVVATREALGRRDVSVEAEVVELRDHAHDVVNTLLTRVPTGRLTGVLDRLADSDALIAVTPVFNASYNGLFKSFFDVLEPDTLTGTPVLIAATGGTPRHSLVVEHAVRPMFSYLRAAVVPTAVYAASEDWGSGSSGGTPLAERVERAAEELAELMERVPSARPDPFAEPTPFERLLAAD